MQSAARQPTRVMIACAVLFAIPFVLVVWTENLSETPRFIDDNQIYTLHTQLHEKGVLWVIQDHFGERLFEMKRLVPVYLAHKLFQVALLGTNLTLWTLYTALVGGLTACALFAFGRLMRFTAFEAFAFALIAVLGEQSVLWWRYLHGEGIGLLLAALALVCIPLSTRRDGRAGLSPVLFVVFAVLASLCKESFVLLLPALALAFVLEHQRMHGGTPFESLRRNAVVIGVLAAVCIAELVAIRFFLGRTYFYYTGWTGFDADRFTATAAEFFSLHRSWILLLVGGIAATVYLVRARQPGGGWRFGRSGLAGLALIVLSLAVLVPQFLLYLSSGFSGQEAVNFSRYLVPSTLALAVLAVFPLQWLRRTGMRAARMVCVAGVAVYLLLRLGTAVEAANAFSRATEDIGDYLDAIAHHVDETDPVLVVTGTHNLHDHTRRATVLLREYLDLENIHYLAVTGAEPSLSFAWDWSETNAYTERIEASTIYDADGLEPSAVLIPFDGYIRLEMFFLLQAANWFDPADYVRFANENGDVAYFRTGNVPERLKDYRSLLTTFGVSGTRDEAGRVRLTGFVQSPEHIERLVLTVDGRPVDAAIEMERRALAHPDLPGYLLDQVRFTLEAEVPDEAPALEAWLGDKLLGRHEITLD